MKVKGGTKLLGEKPIPALLCAPQIWHGMRWDWIWVTIVTGQWLIQLSCCVSCLV